MTGLYRRGFRYCGRCGKWFLHVVRCPDCNSVLRAQTRDAKRSVVYAC